MMMICWKMMDQGLYHTDKKAMRSHKKRSGKTHALYTLPQFSNGMTCALEIVMRYVTEGEKDVKYTMILVDKNNIICLVQRFFPRRRRVSSILVNKLQSASFLSFVYGPRNISLEFDYAEIFPTKSFRIKVSNEVLVCQLILILQAYFRKRY